MRAAVSLLALALLVACQTPTATFTTGYQTPERLSGASPERSLAVVPFDDERPPRLYGTQGRLFLTYIPLLPYVSVPFERLDESIRIQSEGIEAGGHGITQSSVEHAAPPFEEYAYPRSFSRAIADDLGASGLFSEVRFVEADAAGGFDYVLRGTLRKSPLRQSTTSFGLGMVGVLLWVIPVPIQKTSAGVTLDLTLTDTANGATLWTRSLESDLSRLTTLYHVPMVYGRRGAFSFNLISPPSDAQVDRHSLFSWHFEALRRGMLEARADLAATLATAR